MALSIRHFQAYCNIQPSFLLALSSPSLVPGMLNVQIWLVERFQLDQSILLNFQYFTLCFYCCSRRLERLNCSGDLVIQDWTLRSSPTFVLMKQVPLLQRLVPLIILADSYRAYTSRPTVQALLWSTECLHVNIPLPTLQHRASWLRPQTPEESCRGQHLARVLPAHSGDGVPLVPPPLLG